MGKQVICQQCNDTGEYYTIYYSHKKGEYWWSSGIQRKVFCTLCATGRNLKLLSERMKSPDYVNPFTNLSDEQIINMINRSSEFDEPNQLL